MTTPLFLLRCVQLGISIRDLDLLTVGLVNDMYIESDNDSETYAQVGTQAQMPSDANNPILMFRGWELYIKCEQEPMREMLCSRWFLRQHPI
jgi:hypothetical protein